MHSLAKMNGELGNYALDTLSKGDRTSPREKQE